MHQTPEKQGGGAVENSGATDGTEGSGEKGADGSPCVDQKQTGKQCYSSAMGVRKTAGTVSTSQDLLRKGGRY